MNDFEIYTLCLALLCVGVLVGILLTVNYKDK